MMNFIQDKLDVVSKKRSNLFNWRGQFTPEFIEYILEEFGTDCQQIADPFSGSGTVLQQAARLGINATGLDVNPSAYAMSGFFSLCSLTWSERQEFAYQMQGKVLADIVSLNAQPVFTDHKEYRIAYANLIDYARRTRLRIATNQEQIFLMNVLFQSEKDKKLTLKESLLRSFNYIRDTLMKLPETRSSTNAYLADSRTLADYLPAPADLILTSPPYINVFNYHQNYRAITETFGYDILRVAESEFGSNRKNRGNRFKTVIQYCLDMEQAIRGFWKSLADNGKLILVVGRESSVRGVPFYNSELIREITGQIGGFAELHQVERQFTNRFGQAIIEDILVFEKTTPILHSESIGYQIAQQHLTNALARADALIVPDINDALDKVAAVSPSPIFDLSRIVLV